MKKNLFKVSAFCLTLGLFAACSSDEEPVPVIEDDSIELSVTMNFSDIDLSTTRTETTNPYQTPCVTPENMLANIDDYVAYVYISEGTKAATAHTTDCTPHKLNKDGYKRVSLRKQGNGTAWSDPIAFKKESGKYYVVQHVFVVPRNENRETEFNQAPVYMSFYYRNDKEPDLGLWYPADILDFADINKTAFTDNYLPKYIGYDCDLSGITDVTDPQKTTGILDMEKYKGLNVDLYCVEEKDPVLFGWVSQEHNFIQYTCIPYTVNLCTQDYVDCNPALFQGPEYLAESYMLIEKNTTGEWKRLAMSCTDPNKGRPRGSFCFSNEGARTDNTELFRMTLYVKYGDGKYLKATSKDLDLTKFKDLAYKNSQWYLKPMGTADDEEGVLDFRFCKDDNDGAMNGYYTGDWELTVEEGKDWDNLKNCFDESAAFDGCDDEFFLTFKNWIYGH